MKRFAALILLLAAASSFAEAKFGKWRKNGLRRDSSVFDLAAPSAPAGSFSVTKGNAVTFSRASTATCWDHGQTLVNLTANQVCAFNGKWLAEGASTNYVLRSGDLSNASWTKSAGVTATTGTGSDWVDGSTSMNSIATSGAASTATVNQSVTVSGFSYAGSVWVSNDGTPSTTFSLVTKCNTQAVSACKCAVTGGQTCSAAIVSTNFCRATVTPTDDGVYRVQAKALCASSDTGSTLLLTNGTYGVSVPDGTFSFYGAQLEALPSSSSYIPTAGATATRAATSLSVSTTGWPDLPYAAVIDFTPTWNGESTLEFGGAPEANMALLNTETTFSNGWNAGLTQVTGGLTGVMTIAQGVGDQLIGTSLTWAADTTYRLRYEVGGLASGQVWTIKRDGSAISGLSPSTKAQTSTGVIQSTAYIGAHNTLGSRYAWGWLGPKICLAGTTAGCR